VSSDVTTAAQTEQPELKRALGPKLLLLFIVGDILGTGVYALTGDVAGEVGGAAWAPFLVAFAVATITAFSYLELVTKYPQAAGAALYTHKAFGIHFLTFLVAFAVMSSGITSASTASKFFAENLVVVFGLDWGTTAIMSIALVFMALLAVINLRGVSESVKVNVVLTLVELSGLLIVILIGFWAMTQGEADFSRVMIFETGGERSTFVAITAATSLAFFAMVGFEDSVNMAEETHDPSRTFPRSVSAMYARSHTSRRSAIVTTGVPAATYSPGSAFLERTIPLKGEYAAAYERRVLARATPSAACLLLARAWSIVSFLAPSFTRERFSFAPATAARA